MLPNQTDTKTRLTRTIDLRIPLISAAKGHQTEAPMAIAMAQAGGIGVIHSNFTAEAQANEVRRVKKFQTGHGGEPGHHPSRAEPWPRRWR